ncbi:MAG: hypothetical protein E6340_04445 [Actinomyces sp.]|jgi:hypothetical protein|nr:hypothetical protein [Actinomyces sp.]
MTKGPSPWAVLSFKMECDFDVSSIEAFVTVCENAAEVMRSADDDALRAHRIVADQTAQLCSECGADLLSVSQTADGLAEIFDTLKSASEDLRWWVDAAQKAYKIIAEEGDGIGLIASYADGFGSVEIPPERYDELVDAYVHLQARAETQKENVERAEYVFFLELNKLQVDTYEQIISPVFDAFKNQFVPDPLHPWLNSLSYVEGLKSLGASAATAFYMQTYHGKYIEPGDLASRNWFERLTARGDFENWDWQPKGAHAKLPWGLSKVVPVLGYGARRFAVIGTVLDGLGAAHDSYEIDSVKHRDWGTGHKLVRATVSGLATAGGSFLGGEIGAALGGSGGGELGPGGVLVGGFVGGVYGSLKGGQTGEKFGDWFNDNVVDSVAELLG